MLKNKKLTKNNNAGDLFSYIEEENRVNFREQMGSGYMFEGDDKNVILVSRQYTRFYQVWRYSEHKN